MLLDKDIFSKEEFFLQAGGRRGNLYLAEEQVWSATWERNQSLLLDLIASIGGKCGQ